MGFNVKIREPSFFDLFRIKQLNKVYFNAFGSPTYSISRLRILYYLLQKKNNFFIIAEKEKEIVGVAYAHTYSTSDLVYLDFIAVDKGYQRKGIGSALLKAILKKAIDAKKKRIYFIIRSDNEAGIRFYEKHGFYKEKKYYGYNLNLR
jgi:ribosomal protein S18 acetylase RimI-like enzyme